MENPMLRFCLVGDRVEVRDGLGGTAFLPRHPILADDGVAITADGVLHQP